MNFYPSMNINNETKWIFEYDNSETTPEKRKYESSTFHQQVHWVWKVSHKNKSLLYSGNDQYFNFAITISPCLELMYQTSNDNNDLDTTVSLCIIFRSGEKPEFPFDFILLKTPKKPGGSEEERNKISLKPKIFKSLQYLLFT